MPNRSNLTFWVAGLVAAGTALWWLRRLFSAQARDERRRRKSYRPVVSKRVGPSVKLAVKTGKPKR